MFLCYHGLGQYDNRDRALNQLVDTVNDPQRRGNICHHSYNIAGHCMLIAGHAEIARESFLESAHLTHQIHPIINKHNAAHYYLSLF